MFRRKRLKKNRFDTIPELSMTPLIDVALTLLVIFIVSSPMIQHNNIKVNLPNGQMLEAKSKSKNTIVYMDKNNNFYLNGETLSRKKIISQLNKPAFAGETVFIKADRALDYGSVLEFIHEIKEGGVITHVALSTKKIASTGIQA